MAIACHTLKRMVQEEHAQSDLCSNNLALWGVSGLGFQHWGDFGVESADFGSSSVLDMSRTK